MRNAIGAALVGLALSPFVMGFLLWKQVQAPAVAAIKLPQPNAYDDYRAAIRLIRGSDKIASALKQTASQQERNTVLQANAAAIKRLRIGLKRDYHEPPAPPSLHNELPMDGYRDLARLLAVEARYRLARKDPAGAMQSALDAVQMGEDMQRGTVVLGGLVGAACSAIGYRPAWEITDHLNSAQSRGALERLAILQSRHVPYRSVLEQERLWWERIYREYLRNPDLFFSDAEKFEREESGESKVIPKDVPPLVANTMARTLLYTALRRHSSVMKEWEKRAEEPFASETPFPEASYAFSPADAMIGPVIEMLPTSWIKERQVQTQWGMLSLKLALHAYRLDHGAYPESLIALQPKYLKELPEDPFILLSPLKYRLKGKTYLLYSIGPDGKDDGGKPIDDITKKGQKDQKARYYFGPESKGDVVAGINLF